MKLLTTALLIIATLATAHADDRKRHESKRHESHNYIISASKPGWCKARQRRGAHRQAGIDIYPDESMYEKNNFVGYDKR